MKLFKNVFAKNLKTRKCSFVCEALCNWCAKTIVCWFRLDEAGKFQWTKKLIFVKIFGFVWDVRIEDDKKNFEEKKDWKKEQKKKKRDYKIFERFRFLISRWIPCERFHDGWRWSRKFLFSTINIVLRYCLHRDENESRTFCFRWIFLWYVSNEVKWSAERNANQVFCWTKCRIVSDNQNVEINWCYHMLDDISKGLWISWMMK